MRYKLIIFDLDETLWTVHQHVMGPIAGPFEMVDRHEARGATASVRLREGARRVLEDLSKRGKRISIASRSDPDVCGELLRAFDIDRYIEYPQYGWQTKGNAVKNIVRKLRDKESLEIETSDVLFIDDYPANCDSVRETGAATLLFGRDIRSIHELLSVLG